MTDEQKAAETHAESTAEGVALIKELAATVQEGFASVNANIGLVANELDVVKGRLGVVEGRQTELDTRYQRNSDRVRGLVNQTSEADLTHESKLATEIVARQALSAKFDALDVKQDRQLAILESIQKLAANPFVKQVATAVGTAILVWLAAKGIR